MATNATTNIMKHYALIIFLVTGIFSCQAQDLKANNANPTYETIIKSYFDGWVEKDWNLVKGQLAEGFTFTSAAPDDHISVETFKEKCWVQATHIQKFEFRKIVGDDNEAFAIIHVVTNDNRIIRNVEYFMFSDGKIKSIEVFFGGSGQGFPTNSKP